LLGGLACAKNNPNEQVGAARDSAAISDSAKANQSKSGVTDTKTGKSTLGPGATKTRPDQGQPVTSKGDTITAGVDSSSDGGIDRAGVGDRAAEKILTPRLELPSPSISSL
jgi:hypothetical protein